jgi:hypothetical protein
MVQVCIHELPVFIFHQVVLMSRRPSRVALEELYPVQIVHGRLDINGHLEVKCENQISILVFWFLYHCFHFGQEI